MYVLCAALTLDLTQRMVSLHFAPLTRRFMKAMVVAYASGLPAAVGDSLKRALLRAGYDSIFYERASIMQNLL